MKIRQCPRCVELVHFDLGTPIQKCWNCGEVSNFSHLKTIEERVSLWLLRGFDIVLQSALPPCSQIAVVGKVTLVVTMPIAIVMLLICNSFNIRIVHNLSVPFMQP
jgi:hypothetical protein